jgi:hypothetical protein
MFRNFVQTDVKFRFAQGNIGGDVPFEPPRRVADAIEAAGSIVGRFLPIRALIAGPC